MSTARAKLETFLKLLLEADEHVRGAFLIDASPEGGGFPLYTILKPEVKEENIGPEIETGEVVGGILLETYEMLKKLTSSEYLNLGELERVIINGEKATAIIKSFKTTKIVFLLFGRREMKTGFIITLLERIWPELERLARESFSP